MAAVQRAAAGQAWVLRGLAPLGVLMVVTALDVAVGPGQPLLGLTVIAPLLAATITSCPMTLGYAVAAVAAAALLGVYDQQYTPHAWMSQAIRLAGVGFGGVLAVLACRARRRREDLHDRDTARARARAREAVHAAALAENMQRGLLSDPPAVDGLAFAVRYVPAAEQLQIGGDWYDVFPLPGGRTAVVIGDVAGHDGSAAARMAQVRNTLRGLAYVLDRSPAAVLTALDQTLHGLGAPCLATVILAELTPISPGPGTVADRAPPPTSPPPGVRLRWSNAGHPPPMLVRADGATLMLEHPAELLLGVAPQRRRTDHELLLGGRDTLVLFTDGLVEHRQAAIDQGLARVAAALAATGAGPLEQLCDVLLAQVGEHPHDDVAVLAVRV